MFYNKKERLSHSDSEHSFCSKIAILRQLRIQHLFRKCLRLAGLEP